MKNILTIALVLIASRGFSQHIANRNLKAMVDTENAFAQMAGDKNLKEAFLFYLGDNAITAGAQGIIKGKEGIQKQNVTSSRLSWKIAFADMAASGDLGYTTGPWEYRKEKTDKDAVAFGEFNSIWKKQPDGSWKNIMDIGSGHGPASLSVTTATPSTVQLSLKYSRQSPAELTTSLLDRERSFVAACGKDRVKAYGDFLAPQSRLCHEGFLPVTDAVERTAFVRDHQPVVHYEPLGGESAASGDLGYTYGNVSVDVTQDGKTEIKKGVFARFWKRELGDWKVVVDILSY